MSTGTHTSGIERTLKRWAEAFDARLVDYAVPHLAADIEDARSLRDAMAYAVLSPGKRLRPYLVCRCCALSGGSEAEAEPAAAALECIHAFSLVHDDLPAMDDDAMRRGRPTVHVRFGEATAILAGDALLTWAFELIATYYKTGDCAKLLTLEAARAAGARGMIGGQAADIEGERLPANRERVEAIHTYKTARLFECACRMGTIVAGKQESSCDKLADYGRELGRAFQIADDLLDVTSRSEDLGKATGKDTAAGKQTLVRCVGVEESRRLAREHADRAINALKRLGPEADDLRDLARFALERSH